MIERVLTDAIDRMCSEPCPPGLAAAIRHAVFPAGGRIRPNLCCAVFEAVADETGLTGADRDSARALALAAGCSIELLHCASLVHDDLPCFDDADIRRGKATVHKAFGEALAVLAGDALLVGAFDLIGRAALAPKGDGQQAALGAIVFQRVVQCVAAPSGIIAGQAWESEDVIDLAAYHDAKTGALFVAATACGALAAHGDIARWEAFGSRIGQAYQVADDLKDCLFGASETGKPEHQDVRNDRPSAVVELGVQGARQRLKDIVDEALALAGTGPGSSALQALVLRAMGRLLPSVSTSDETSVTGLRPGDGTTCTTASATSQGHGRQHVAARSEATAGHVS
ncbi:MAG: polyprenyl synthetase family protein [Hyphomicrobiaceae bacterium]